MANDLTLTKQESAYVFDGVPSQHVWPLKVTAASTIAGLSSKIFVFHAAMGADQWKGDTFDCVASVPQMTEIPEDAPVAVDGDVIPYYRKDTVELWLRSPELLAETWEAIQEHTQDLIDNYRATQSLTAGTTVTLD